MTAVQEHAPGKDPAEALADVRFAWRGTTARFALLLALFLASSAGMLDGLLSDARDLRIYAPKDGSFGCMLAAGVDPAAGNLPNFLANLRAGSAYDACLARYAWNPPGWLPYASMALMAGAAAALYWLVPAWKGRRGKSVTVAGDDPLARELAGLAAEAGLARVPVFAIDPAAATTGAVAFGRARRHTVRLDGGLIACRHREPDRFRAVVLHELAHVRNGDVGITYATVAVWRVYLSGVLLPGVIGQTWSLFSAQVLGHGQIMGVGARSATYSGDEVVIIRDVLLSVFTLVLVYLMRADILRHREISADVTAARWGAAASGWKHGDKPGATSRGARRMVASFAELWRTHPDWDLRRDSLADPAALFEVSSLQMFLAGAAAWVAASTLQDAISAFAPGAAWPGVTAVPWLLPGGLIAATVTVALWPTAARSSVGIPGQPGTAGPPALRAGLWLGAGLLAGLLLDVKTGGGQWLPGQPAFLLALPVLALIATRWTAEHARLALRNWRSVRVPVLTGLAVTWLLFGLGIGWWQNQGLLLDAGYPLATAADVTAFNPAPILAGHLGVLTAFTAVDASILPSWNELLFIIAGAALWLVPLLTLTWPAGRDGLRPAPRPPRLRFTVCTGVAGGACCWAVAIAGIFILRSWHVPFSERFGSYVILFIGWLAVAVASGMAAAACAGRALSRDYWLTAGLSAAGIASLLGFGGAYLLTAADGCTGPLTAIAHSCAWRPSNGWQAAQWLPPLAWGLAIYAAAALALLTAGIAAVGARLGRSFRPATSKPQPPACPPVPVPRGHPARAAARAGAVVLSGACAAALIVAVHGFVSTAPATTPTAAQSAAQDPQPAYPAPPALRRVQVDAWFIYGGISALGDLEIDTGKALLAIGKAEKADRSRDPARVPLTAPVKHACAVLAGQIRQADNYFPVPDPPLQGQWQSLLTRVAAASRDCLQAFAQRKPTLVVIAANELDGTPFEPLWNRLDSVAGLSAPAKS